MDNENQYFIKIESSEPNKRAVIELLKSTENFDTKRKLAQRLKNHYIEEINCLAHDYNLDPGRIFYGYLYYFLILFKVVIFKRNFIYPRGAVLAMAY